MTDMSRLIDRDSLGVGRCNPDVMLDPAYAAGWNGLLNIINSAPTLDPVHAAGGCYCRECRQCDGFPGPDIAPGEVGICTMTQLVVEPDGWCKWSKQREAQDD